MISDRVVSMFKSSAKPLVGEVKKQGNLVKRSQNKKRFSLVNYKSRWFVLTTKFLAYYEGECEVRFSSTKHAWTVIVNPFITNTTQPSIPHNRIAKAKKKDVSTSKQ